MADPASADHFRNRDAQLLRGARDYFALDTKWPRHALFPNVSNTPMLLGERTDWGYDASILQVQLDAVGTPAAHAVLLDRSPAFIADEVRVGDHPEAVALLQAGRHVAAFARGARVEVAAASAAEATVRIVEYAPHRIVYAVEGDAPKVVVFNELAIPGWSLRIDGHFAPIHTANGYFRTAIVPAGMHQCEFRYIPPGLPLGIVLSLLGLVMLFAVIGVLHPRRPID
jgi:hypothetical protein